MTSSVVGRVARSGSAVYKLTKWGVGGFSEALRQELLEVDIRVSIVEPGATATELLSHNAEPVREAAARTFAGVERLEATDIADAIVDAIGQPPRVAINELLVRPRRQER